MSIVSFGVAYYAVAGNQNSLEEAIKTFGDLITILTKHTEKRKTKEHGEDKTALQVSRKDLNRCSIPPNFRAIAP